MRILPAAAATTALGLLGATAVAVGLPSAGAAETSTYTASAHRIVHTPPLPPGAFPRPGTTTVVLHGLRTRPGDRAAGYYLQSCTVVEQSATDSLAHCTGEVVQPGRTITVQGVRRSGARTNTLAVTGGAGSARGASGQVVVEHPGGDVQFDVLTLTLD